MNSIKKNKKSRSTNLSVSPNTSLDDNAYHDWLWLLPG